jgi:diketogulonate reductase-like aldo/keto reductase
LNCDFVETWAAMEELVDAGLCRSLGISNFTPAQVIRLLQDGCKKYKPAVLQNEMHLYLQEQDFVDFCKHHGIVFQAYSPLGSGVNNPSQPLWNPECRVIEHPVLKKIAEAKGATPAQVALRWEE